MAGQQQPQEAPVSLPPSHPLEPDDNELEPDGASSAVGSPNTDAGSGEAQSAATEPPRRVFLVVVDESDEMMVALRFACRRALRTSGRVALLHVLEPADFSYSLALESLMEEDRRLEAEKQLQKMAARVNEWTGTMPILYLREGARRAELLKLIEEEPQISILVLGANTGPKGAGPLIEALTGKFIGKLRIPMTVVPGNLSQEDVDALA